MMQWYDCQYDVHSFDDCANPFFGKAWRLNAQFLAPVAVAGTVRNLRVRLTAAPGTGKSRTYTIEKNGTATALTLTISDLATEGITTGVDVTVAVGDSITIRPAYGNNPAASGTWSRIEFESDTDTVSMYSLSRTHALTGSLAYNGIFRGLGNWEASEGFMSRDIVGADGDLTGYYVNVAVAPGVGKSWTFAVYKNGTKQDGSGGTVDTRVTISDAATQGNISFTLPLVVGDRVSFESSPSGTPALPRMISWSSSFDADDPHTSIVCGKQSSLPSNTTANYFHIMDSDIHGINATESVIETLQATTPFRLTNIFVDITTSPGTGKSYTFDARLNQTSPGGTPTVTLSDAETEDSAAGDLAVAAGDLTSLRVVPSNTPAAQQCSWTFACVMGAPDAWEYAQVYVY